MTNRIVLKRSGSADSVPLAGNLEYGELAINYADGNLFYKNASNNIVAIASNRTLTLSGNITAGNVISNDQIQATGNITGANISISGNIVGGNILSDNYFFANGAPLSAGGGFSEFRSLGGNLSAASNAIVTFSAANGISVSANVTTSTISIGVLPGLTGNFNFGFVTEPVDAGFDFGSIL